MASSLWLAFCQSSRVKIYNMEDIIRGYKNKKSMNICYSSIGDGGAYQTRTGHLDTASVAL